MIFFALWMGRDKRYRYAADHLRSCEQLAARIDDWQGHPDHQAYRQRLEEMFERKWGLLDTGAPLSDGRAGSATGAGSDGMGAPQPPVAAVGLQQGDQGRPMASTPSNARSSSASSSRLRLVRGPSPRRERSGECG